MIFIFLTSGLFLAWSLGANELTNVFGTAVSSRMVSFKKAAIIATIFIILGAVFQGNGTSNTLVELGTINAIAGAFTVTLAAVITVFLMRKYRLLVSTSQAIVGAIIGWNLFTGNTTNINSLSNIVISWILCPILGAVFAIVLFTMLKLFLKKVKIHLIKLDSFIRYGLLIVGAFGSYSLGANNIANVMGVFIPSVIIPKIEIFGIFILTSSQQLFLLGGVAIAIGIFTYSKRILQTVENDVLSLTSESALVVVLAHSLVLFIFSSQSLSNFIVSIGLPAIPLVPVSSSHAIIGAIIGIGILRGGSEIKLNVIGQIAIGWISTPLIAGTISFFTLFFVNNVFQQPVAKLDNKDLIKDIYKNENIIVKKDSIYKVNLQ